MTNYYSNSILTSPKAVEVEWLCGACGMWRTLAQARLEGDALYCATRGCVRRLEKARPV